MFGLFVQEFYFWYGFMDVSGIRFLNNIETCLKTLSFRIFGH